MMSTLRPAITAEIHEVAHDFTLRAVLMSTAVVGNHHASHETRLAAATHRTSCGWLHLVWVSLSAILAEMSVSRIEMTAIISQLVRMVWMNLISRRCGVSDDIQSSWISWKLRLGNWSERRRVSRGRML